MQPLPPLFLKNGPQQHLCQAQEKIDQLPSYYKKVKQAKVLWQNKKKTKAQKAAFNRIEKALQKGGSHCHYCEGSLGTSIEHFYPRGFYPNLTFVWENYLWSCQTCNTQYKGAQFAIFATNDKAKIIPLVKDRSFVPPANQEAVCLNPRVDNALDYWQLDLSTGHYNVKPNLDARAQARAEYTLDLLQLNGRSKLVKGRKKAFLSYQQLLEAAVILHQQPTVAYIKNLLPKKQASFYNQSLDKQQELALQYLHQQFVLLPYKNVWRCMQQQTSLQQLFEQAPTVLNW